MVSDSAKVWQVRKCKKPSMIMPVSSVLMNRQVEAVQHEKVAAKQLDAEYMRYYFAPVPKSTC